MRTATAIEGGFSRWELATKAWDHPHHGIVRPSTPGGPSVRDRIEDAIALLTPGAVLTGWAAAYRQGVTMLDGVNRAQQPQPVTIGTPERGQLRPRPGIAPTRRSIHRNEVILFDGVPMTHLARAAYDMALDARNLREALVPIEMCTSTVIAQSRTTVGNVADVIASHKKTRGIVQARRALEIASTRSASPWETRTRYEAHIGAGIRGLLVNVPIFDLHGGLAGIADLLEPESGLVIESDGAGHRQEVTHAEDNVREEAFERLGLFVARVTALDHRDRQALHGRLAAARLHASMGRRDRLWTLETPGWWETWAPGRRWR